MTPSSQDTIEQKIEDLLDEMQLDYTTQTISLESKLERGVIGQEEYTERCNEEYKRCIRETTSQLLTLITQSRIDEINKILDLWSKSDKDYEMFREAPSIYLHNRLKELKQ